eukprot:10784824-Alexandrium_andersonii.AAC.1
MRFEKGIWLGKNTKTNEHLIGMGDGVVTTRTVRRLAVNDQTDVEALAGMTGVPWAMRSDPSASMVKRRRVGPLAVIPEAAPLGTVTPRNPTRETSEAGDDAARDSEAGDSAMNSEQSGHTDRPSGDGSHTGSGMSTPRPAGPSEGPSSPLTRQRTGTAPDLDRPPAKKTR